MKKLNLLSRVEMKKITGGWGSCIPEDDRDRPCLLAGAITSCREVPCCCGSYCGGVLDENDNFVDRCISDPV
ncbi:hypothetical protein [Pedobacter sp. Hv1]|uniref:hypothetical protein n=1 Tax=Pedobacter sp. Hv1 TaxID=1740090 RepID=UPI000ACB56BD|nr:hypothetical protein [Pedobacter sp. Hv1]